MKMVLPKQQLLLVSLLLLLFVVAASDAIPVEGAITQDESVVTFTTLDQCVNVCPQRAPKYRNQDDPSSQCNATTVQGCKCTYPEETGNYCFFSCLGDNWAMACAGGGDDGGGGVAGASVDPTDDSDSDSNNNEWIHENQCTTCPETIPDWENGASCDMVDFANGCVCSRYREMTGDSCFLSCLEGTWQMACAGGGTLPDDTTDTTISSTSPFRTPQECINVCPDAIPDWESRSSCNNERMNGCFCTYPKAGSECFVDCQNGSWAMACAGGGPTVPDDSDSTTTDDRPTDDAPFRTPQECIDVCPDTMPDWKNRSSCDAELLNDCTCTYPEESSDCFVACQDGSWAMACAGGIPDNDDTDTTTTTVSTFRTPQECVDICPDAIPDWESRSSCDTERLNDCFCTYPKSGSECFVDCQDGGWGMACARGGNTVPDDNTTNNNTTTTTVSTFRTPQECMDICPDTIPDWESRASCDKERTNGCFCTYPKSGSECFVDCQDGGWAMACAGDGPRVPDDTTNNTTTTVSAFRTPQECMDICPDTIPDWESRASCDKERINGCFCTYPKSGSECFVDCTDDGWAMACADGPMVPDDSGNSTDSSFRTPPECMDICPDRIPDWENRSSCDKERNDGCFCTYPKSGSECFVDCQDDGWAMACAGDQPTNPDDEGECASCPQRMPDWSSHSSCDMNEYKGCNCSNYDDINEDCFLSCIDGTWSLGCYGNDGTEPKQCVDVCPDSVASWLNGDSCDANGCNCTKYDALQSIPTSLRSDTSKLPQISEDCFLSCTNGAWSLACEGTPSFNTPERCTTVCPETIPDWEKKAQCDSDFMDGCICSYAEAGDLCFMDCVEGSWAIKCGSDHFHAGTTTDSDKSTSSFYKYHNSLLVHLVLLTIVYIIVS